MKPGYLALIQALVLKSVKEAGCQAQSPPHLAPFKAAYKRFSPLVEIIKISCLEC